MISAAFAALSAAALLAAQDPPPLQNPGAPGEATRAITAQESVDMSRSRHTQADIRFMQHMIVHHDQAVEMNALIAERTSTQQVIALGERIARTQHSEMAMMRRWLRERDAPLSDPHLHHGHAMHSGHSGHGDHAGMGHDAGDRDDVPLMPGMLSPHQMAELAAARGRSFDRLFLEGMIHHHEGALAMVEALLAEPGNGEDPQLSEFLTHVTADQAAEILRMQSMLSAYDHADAGEEETHRP